MMDGEIGHLLDAIKEYKPGSTARSTRERPQNPPPRLRIGLFGPPGVGKSAFINSAIYATLGKKYGWVNKAPEGFAVEASKTKALDSYDISEYISLVDNRGMRNLGGNFMVELSNQVAGLYGDKHEVEWDSNFIKRLVSGLRRTFSSSQDCEIHTCLLVVSARSLIMQPQDLEELVDTIRNMTGEPPIVIITNIRNPQSRNVVSSFCVGLQQIGINFVFQLENYTVESHEYDHDKHICVLRALQQCLVVGDVVMKNKESNKCTIL